MANRFKKNSISRYLFVDGRPVASEKSALMSENERTRSRVGDLDHPASSCIFKGGCTPIRPTSWLPLLFMSDLAQTY